MPFREADGVTASLFSKSKPVHHDVVQTRNGDDTLAVLRELADVTPDASVTFRSQAAGDPHATQ